MTHFTRCTSGKYPLPQPLFIILLLLAGLPSVSATGLLPGVPSGTEICDTRAAGVLPEDACAPATPELTMGCGPITSLPCADVARSLPISLTFDGTEGGLTDKNGLGTGFTMAVAPSVNQYPATPTNPAVPGLESSLLEVFAGDLQLTTTKGTAFLSPATTPETNNQVNMLGAGFQQPGSVFDVSVQLNQPNFLATSGSNSQEGGLWYGIGQDNYVKLVTQKSSDNSQQVRLTVERPDPSTPGRVLVEELGSTRLSFSNPTTIELRLEIDPVYQSVRGFYAFDGGQETLIIKELVDSLALPQVLRSGVDHDADGATPNLVYAGVIGSHRSASVNQPLLLSFKKFDVTVQPFVPTLIWNKSLINISSLEGEAIAPRFVELFTNNSTAPVITLSDDPSSADWLILPNTPTVGTIELNVRPNLPAGRYSTTLFATSPGYLSGELEVSLIVSTPDDIPFVIRSTPSDGEVNVSLNTSVSANDLHLPNGLNGIFGVENNSITNNTVKLFKVSNEQEIPATVNGTGGGDGINLTPNIPLEINTQYRFEIDGVKDLTGVAFAPFTATFTTASDNTSAGSALDNVSFTNAGNVATDGMYSSLTIGPDGKLYGLQLTGQVDRWVIASDGRLNDKETFTTLPDTYGSRTAIGFAFDPTATATDLRVYVSHAEGVLNNGNPWDGKISRLSGPELQNEDLVVTRLPRSRRDHLTNGITFRRGEGPVLYFNQGSNSAGGAPDNSWGNRMERLLTAATLRLDLELLPESSWPLDAKTTMNQAAINAVDLNSPTLGSGTGTYRENNLDFPDDGTYNPFYVNAPLTIFATGIRNAYDLVWHSNGQLYIPNNGTAGGSNTPASVDDTRRVNGTYYDHNDPARRYPVVPATFANNTQRDFLFRVDPDQSVGYYGHPNPLRGEYVLNRGPVDARNYPNNVAADNNFRGIAFDFQFNKSPNGVIEYQSNAEGGNLRGALLVCRYSGGSDIIALVPNGPNGDILTSKIGIPGFRGFGDPLDITEDPSTGNLYVSDLARQTIVLLKPSAQAAPEPVVSIIPEEVITEDIVGFGPGEIISPFIVNTGNAPLEGPIARITGPDSLSFTLDASSLPDVLNPNSSTSVTIRFDPATVGPKFANLIVTGTSGVEGSITLSGLGVAGYGGTNEPSLQQILDVHSLSINVGDQDPVSAKLDIPSGNTYDDLFGDEIFGQLFQAATDAPVLVEVLGVFGPEAADPIVGFGWYRAGLRNTTDELFTVGNSTVRNGQTLSPEIDGTLSFDPGFEPIGFFSHWPFHNDRYIFSEDALNTFAGAAPHHMRVYEVPNQDNTYIIATEDHVSGFDYNDIVIIVRNVEPIPEPLAPRMVVQPDILYLEGRFGAQGNFPDTATVSVLNTGTLPLEINGIAFGGQYPELMSVHMGPDTTVILPGGVQDYQVVFSPETTFMPPGYRPATMLFNTNTDLGLYTLPIRAMRKRGRSGQYEPPLQLVAETLNLGIDVGWATLSSDTSTILKGDEVRITRFEAAGPGPVTIEPVARYSPIETIPFGWYTHEAGVVTTHEVGVMADGIDASQTLYPPITSGGKTFSYQGVPFGVYISSNVFDHTIYTADDLNASPVARRARLYPVKGADGEVVPFTYLVAFEDATNGDYQDYVFILRNAREFVPPAPALVFSEELLNVVVATGSTETNDQTTLTTNSTIQGPAPKVALSSDASWLSFPDSVDIGASIPLTFSSFGLTPGLHTEALVATAAGFLADTLTVTIAVNEGESGAIRINFQDNSFSPPATYFADYGEAYDERIGGYTYGWTDAFTGAPSDNASGAAGAAFGLSNASTDEDKLLRSLNRFNVPGYFLPHNWELALRNGLWAIRLGVGSPVPDPDKYAIYAEGSLLVDNFSPTNSNLFQIGVDTVRILDGKLTIGDGNVAMDGKTKILFLEAVPVDSSGFGPEIIATITGNPSPTGGYYGNAVVTLEAFDRSGSGRIAAVRYRVNGGAYALYDEPIELVSQSGAIVDYHVEYDATDLFGNTGSGESFIRVEPATGAVIRLENMVKIPGTDIGFPSDDWYGFNKILGPNDFRVTRLSITGRASCVSTTRVRVF